MREDDSPEAGARGEGIDGEVHGEVLDDPLDGIQGGAAGDLTAAGADEEDDDGRADLGGGRRRWAGGGGGGICEEAPALCSGFV